MSLADKELPEGLDPERTIIHSVYCGHCGYNLRFGTYVGRCNECGSPYNARPLAMKGIFTPLSLRFPTGDILLTLACGVISFSTLRGALRPFELGAVLFAVVAGLIGGVFAVVTARRLSRFLRAFRIQRRIREEEY